MCKSASPAVLSRIQLTLHAARRTPQGASRLVQEISAWSVKTRHAPSRHCRDARGYGHTTTAMNETEYSPPTHPTPHTLIWWLNTLHPALYPLNTRLVLQYQHPTPCTPCQPMLAVSYGRCHCSHPPQRLARASIRTALSLPKQCFRLAELLRLGTTRSLSRSCRPWGCSVRL